MVTVAERRGYAMGTTAHVIAVGPGADMNVDRAFDRIADLERKWSRFLPDSEISLLNAFNGELVCIGPETDRLLTHAVTAASWTNGAFNPLMERQVVAAGYNRSFEVLDQQESRSTAKPAHSWNDIVIDHDRCAATLPSGVGFDPGGIGKGLAADIVVGESLCDGALGVLVSIGGDMAMKGQPPQGNEWVVEVREPAIADERITILSLVEGAVATSTTARRRWMNDEAEQHHILDPNTGRPTTTNRVLATVVADDAWWAEAAATALIVGERVNPSSCEYLAMATDGSTERSAAFAGFET